MLRYDSFLGGGGGPPNNQATFAVVKDNLRTTTGTQDFTVTGFGTPKAAFFIMGAGSPILGSYGAADGTNQWCVAWAAENNVGTTDTEKRGLRDEVICQLNLSGATAIEANFDSFISDGVRINLAKTDASARPITVILFGGAGLQAAVGHPNLATQGNTITETIGFSMNAIITGYINGAFGDVTQTPMRISTGFGSWDGATIRQSCHHMTSNNGSAAGDPVAITKSDAVATGPGTPDITLENITSTSFDLRSNGEDVSTQELGYLALELPGGEAWAGVIDSPTSTGNNSWTDPGFQPDIVLIVPTLVETLDAQQTDGTAGGFGLSVFDGTEEWCTNWTDEDTADPTVADTDTTNQAIDQDADDNTALFDATFVSFDANGFTLNFSATDTVNTKKWPTLAIKGG